MGSHRGHPGVPSLDYPRLHGRDLSHGRLQRDHRRPLHPHPHPLAQGYRPIRVINLFAEPGAGKSTTAAGLFFIMKVLGVKCELITEYPKELSYEKPDGKDWPSQWEILKEQTRRLERLDGKVDFAITDSPLPHVVLYASRWDDLLRFHAWDSFHSYDNVNYRIRRVRPFQEYGRVHNAQQAAKVSASLDAILPAGTVNVPGDYEAPGVILKDLKARGLI